MRWKPWDIDVLLQIPLSGLICQTISVICNKSSCCQVYCALSAVCLLDLSSCDEHGEQQCKIIPIAIRSEAGMPDVQVSLVHTRALKAPPFKLKSIRIHKEQKPKIMKLYPQKAIKASAS